MKCDCCKKEIGELDGFTTLVVCGACEEDIEIMRKDDPYIMKMSVNSDKKRDNMNVDKKYIDLMIEGLNGAFTWSDSPQGYDFWADVEEKLLTIRDK